MQHKVNIMWFRRDLRLADNNALLQCLKSGQTLPLFIFEEDVLNKDKNDLRTSFIVDAVKELQKKLKETGSDLEIRYGSPAKIFPNLIRKYKIDTVFCNHDYDSASITRDNEIREYLTFQGIKFKSFKDHVIFEGNELLQNGKPILTHNAFKKCWIEKINRVPLKFHDNKFYYKKYLHYTAEPFDFNSLGINYTKTYNEPHIDFNVLKNYHKNRDVLSIKNATTKISTHLRFGTISIRKCISVAFGYSEKWLDELIWREFFFHLMFHFPDTATQPFRNNYENIEWKNNPDFFEKWKQGKTGFPLVDAGMRELNATGFMPNRVRIVCASFLCKNLLIDWRLGERYFASKLLDYELAVNVGNWQWIVGSGIEASAYFKIFNPKVQEDQHDPHNTYITKWVPEISSPEYLPIVDFDESREEALKMYKKALIK